jgi:hypothetical protein
MRASFETDEFGRLVCALDSAGSRTAIVATDARQAALDLLAAVDAAEIQGCGDCYWRQPAGEYRWLLRRDGPRLRLAILWMTGVLTGWEHVYQGESGFEEFVRDVRSQLRRFQTAGA